MKIVVIARTRNESRNIERFCSAYQWADRILIADGKSEDDTVLLAQRFNNVSTRPFWQMVMMDNGVIRTPHGEHLNFLIDWAIDVGADWIIHDDVDCFPNYLVKRDVRNLIGIHADYFDFIYLTRLYLYKDQGHFPKMAQPIKRGKWEQGLWAWSSRSGFRFRENIPVTEHQQPVWDIPNEKIHRIEPPYCLLHCPWQDDEMIERKLSFYRKSGEVPNMRHPMETGLSLEPLPEWARE